MLKDMVRLPYKWMMQETWPSPVCTSSSSAVSSVLFREDPFGKPLFWCSVSAGYVRSVTILRQPRPWTLSWAREPARVLTKTGEKMRRLMHHGQMFQSHALHFFHLVSPDLLFGADADPAIRNVIGVALEHKDLAVQGVMMRKYGQEIIRATAGKKIHGTGAIPGGINKNLSIAERDEFLKGPDPLNIEKMVQWAQGALDLFKDYHAKNKDLIDNFAVFPSNHLSLVRKDGAMDLYHGVLRAVDKDGKKILNDVDYQDYYKYINEEVRNWSYMKFPFLTVSR